MSNYISIEIVEQVLLRLPIKPLLKYSSTCKTWYNLITSTDFISTHLDFTKSLHKSTQLFIHCGLDDDKYVIYSDDEAGTLEEYVRFPVKISRVNWRLAGCCNGLICLTNNKLDIMESNKVVLWNPMIRRTLCLPESGYGGVPRAGRTFGFVFDHIGNDYKVLRLYGHSLDNNVPSMVEVFRLSTGLWEYISCEAPFRLILREALQADLKGIAHWIGLDNDLNLKIITFDVHEEVFGSIELPEIVVYDDELYFTYWEKYLFVFDESLFLIHIGTTTDVYDYDKCKFEIWRMGEYGVYESWKQVDTWIFDELMQLLGFRKNGEILWVTKDEKFVSTNLVDASYNYLDSCQDVVCSSSSCLYYAESLTLLDKSLSSGVDDPNVDILQE